MTGTGARPSYDGSLQRFAERTYALMVLGAWFIVVSLPFWLSLVLLVPDVSNAVLFAACALSLGPALTGALYGVRRLDQADAPGRLYLRGLHQGWRQSLALAAPVVLIAAILGVNVAVLSRQPGGVGFGWTVAFGAVALLGVPWAWLSQAIAAHYAFRTRDVARLAASYVLIRPLVSLGLLALTAALAILVAWTFDWLLAFTGSLVALAVTALARPVFAHLDRTFVADENVSDPTP